MPLPPQHPNQPEVKPAAPAPPVHASKGKGWKVTEAGERNMCGPKGTVAVASAPNFEIWKERGWIAELPDTPPERRVAARRKT